MVRPPDIHAHRILILDFGAQYTQLIARRVREFGVYCEIHPWDMSDAEVRAFGARGIILSGGPESVTDAEPPKAPQAVFEAGVPMLGICYGMQTMAQQLGGRVSGRITVNSATPRSPSPRLAGCSTSCPIIATRRVAPCSTSG